MQSSHVNKSEKEPAQLCIFYLCVHHLHLVVKLLNCYWVSADDVTITQQR